eukprot:XP_001697695.1 predicted protein [Chlamydomonas reinhardtii]
MSEGSVRALRIAYNCGMAAAWPLLANLFVALLPVERSLLLLAALGAGHEDGVAAHTWAGTAAHGDWERRLAAAAEQDSALEGGAVST